jgi:MFS family permease
VIVTDLVPLRDVGKYISFTGLIWAIADVAGPLLGGAFSQYVELKFLMTPFFLSNSFFSVNIPCHFDSDQRSF